MNVPHQFFPHIQSCSDIVSHICPNQTLCTTIICVYIEGFKSCSYSVSYVYPRPRVCTKIVYFVSSSTRMVYTVGFRFKVCWVLFRSFFMFFNFCRLYLHNKTHGCISKPTMKIYKKHTVNWTSLNLVTVIGSVLCWFLNQIHRSFQPVFKNWV